jgi:hypothetical protein
MERDTFGIFSDRLKSIPIVMKLGAESKEIPHV